jgi:GMP synthase (glutamine-hydrolysing)
MRKVIIIDFGSQYTLLIARELRRLHVYCEVRILNDSLFEDLKENRKKIDALILSGGPHSVPAIEEEPPFIQLVEFLRINAKLEWVDGERKKQKPIPVLAICFGAQLLAHCFGGEVVACETRREYGESWLRDFDVALSTIFTGIDDPTKVWMSHSDSILVGGGNMIKVLARPGVDRDEVAVFQIMGSGRVPMLGLQFHPEVSHTQDGGLWLRNFCLMADVEFSWYPDAFIQQSIKEIRKQVKAGLNREVLVACSGGVDSSVMAVLLNRALGDRCRCVFLNNGLLRAGEFEEIYEIYNQLGLNIQGIDCSSDFYQELVGVTDPEQKRKVIGRVFVEQFQNFVEGGEVGYLAQGTIYPDVVESHGKIKSHHNVGGLPEKLHLELIEPLRLLFKMKFGKSDDN